MRRWLSLFLSGLIFSVKKAENLADYLAQASASVSAILKEFTPLFIHSNYGKIIISKIYSFGVQRSLNEEEVSVFRRAVDRLLHVLVHTSFSSDVYPG